MAEIWIAAGGEITERTADPGGFPPDYTVPDLQGVEHIIVWLADQAQQHPTYTRVTTYERAREFLTRPPVWRRDLQAGVAGGGGNAEGGTSQRHHPTLGPNDVYRLLQGTENEPWKNNEIRAVRGSNSIS